MDQTEIRYVTNESGAWVSTRVIGTPGFTGQCSIAQGADGSIHIGSIGGGAKYATNESGAWVTVNVSATDGNTSSIGLDADGAVHMAWQGGSDVWYATNMDGAWDAQALATDDVDGYAPAMAVAPDGTAHVIQWDFTSGDVLYGAVVPQNGVDDDCDGVAW
jgi:hypothetical protein